MKVGILTIHHVPNFGANLQAYTTLNYLRRRGVDVEIINFRNPKRDREYSQGRIPAEQLEAHESFITGHLSEKSELVSIEDLKRYVYDEGFDKIVVGSDSLLRQSRNSDELSEFWCEWALDLGRDLRIFFFAVSSMGSLFFIQNKNLRERMRRSLGFAEIITYRDAWTGFGLRRLLDRKDGLAYCPDPVNITDSILYDYVPDNEDFVRLSGKDYAVISTGYDITEADALGITKVFNERGLMCVSIPVPERVGTPFCDLQISQPLSPLDWYFILKSSKFILSDRFHPTVVAFSNHIPFVTLDSYAPRFRPYLSKIWDISRTARQTRRSLRGRYRYKPNSDILRNRINMPLYNIEIVNREKDIVKNTLDRILEL